MLSTFKIVEICHKYDINVEQFFLINLLHRKDYKTFIEYVTKCKKSFYTNQELLVLANKGILEAEPIAEAIKVNSRLEMFDLFLTEEFRDLYYIDSEEAGKELWENYPNTTFIDGRDVPLKKGDKIGNVYYDKDTLIKLYCDKIQNNLDKHREIISKLKANKDKINFAIRSFILDEMWDSLEDKGSDEKQYNNTLVV